MNPYITFIGFGEASYHIAKGLNGEGYPKMYAFDIMSSHPERGQLIHDRANEAQVEIISDMKEAIEKSKYIISATSAKIAVDIAKSVLPFMTDGQIFIDINAASPMSMKEIDQLDRPEGVKFCDSAVMGVVPTDAHKVPMLLSGDGAKEVELELSKYGMNLRALNGDAGGSSAIKMFRSIFMKGLTQLMIESFVSANEFGVLDEMVSSLSNSIDDKKLVELANQLIPRTIVHAERRVSEMKEVVLTLKSLNQDSLMSEATRDKLSIIAASEHSKAYNGVPPKDYVESIEGLTKIFTK